MPTDTCWILQSIAFLKEPTQFKQSFQISDYSTLKCDTSFPKTKSWNESRDCCSWDGVTCDLLNGHVIGLDLSCSQLRGSIHPNSSLFQLHHLQTVNLAYNNFSTSSISHNIGRWRNLRHLNLSNSFFSGKIPTEISFLSNLVSLDLSSSYGLQLDERTFETMLHNFTNLEVLALFLGNISSPIPVSIHPNSSLFQLHHLHTLNLVNNFFYPSSIPNGIGRLRNLRHLKLYGFQGKIPTEISYLSNLVSLDLSYSYERLQLDERTFEAMFQNLTNLELLSLYGVNISSQIPVNISSSLRYLDLGYTNLRGVLTENFFLLPNLEILKLSGNDLVKGVFPKIHWSNTLLTELDISSTGISGEVPDSIGTFSSLNILNLAGCQFSGSIPDSISNLTQIRELILYHNHFTGHIPSTISKLKHLTRLDLSINSFSGEIPDVFSNLQELRTLHLSYNSFIGSFPASILSLTHLEYLGLSSNSLSGPLPSNQSMLQKLTELNLSYNSLNGHLPQFRYDNLQYLDLKFNYLQGPLALSICNMRKLILLDLSHNYFSDSVPHCLGSMPNLRVLDLRRNNFTGSLPPLCAQSTSLSTIVVNGNRFEGPVPVSLLNCNGLQVLDVGNNAINDTFPAWLGTLQELQVLILKSNKFHGPISTCHTKFCFPKLRIFDLSRNDFSGSLPAKVFGNFKAMIKLDGEDTGNIKYMESMSNLPFVRSYEDSVSLVIKGQDIELQRISTIMTTIDLSNNHFEGVIPKTLKDLSSLWLLNLSHNNLLGHIPMELGQLNTLEALDLSWNWLTGKIPQELTRMNFLAVLNLSQNHLVGPIPQGPQFNTFENDSYCGNLDLCGPPLSKQCETSDSSHVPQQLESEEEGESYFFSGFTWESVVIGYSFGLVVGTVMWSLISYEDSVSLVIKGKDIELQRISTITTTIDLSSNHFESVIPETLKDLRSLWRLNLSHNNLSGDIPMKLGQLSMLEALDLSWNRLTGKIPQELTRMNFLAFLNLSQNHLVGPIPQGRQFNTFENDSYGGNLDLCGLPLTKKCGTSDSSHVPQQLESKEEGESYFF
ncbi:receptor-like protein 9DC1 [Solanum stenotomum]|uniref:receptor-like protein 9DC1 n=1 Tax=Solanum stenotomum TaxID=172797 RepID=UPI0020D11116|nr:receptor-like protein 9DC1 [Solanum stenotomum]